MRDELLAYIRETDRPLSYGELSARFSDEKALKAALGALEAEGEIVRTAAGLWSLPEAAGYVRGRWDGAGNFGFVQPETGEKVFVPGRFSLGAMHGDTVLALITHPAEAGRSPEGEIARILTHAVKALCGELKLYQKRWYVEPDDRRLGEAVVVPRAALGAAKEGDKVIVTLTRWPEGREPAGGEITAVLGPARSLDANYRSVLYTHGVRIEFPAEVQFAAQSLGERGIPAAEKLGRADLRDRLIFTIDGADAKDFDDAVSLETNENGNRVLGVHIADVSHYVTEGSTIDREAFLRGTSLYFTDQVVPMLPFALSDDLCSLRPGEDRLAFSTWMELNEDDDVISFRMEKSVIRSACRCVYGELNELLAGSGDKRLQEKYAAVLPTLGEMTALAASLTKKRFARGALDFDSDEAVIIMDEKGEPVDIVPRERGVTERMIEEFMILCNEAVAKWASGRGLPFVYRVHEAPDSEKTAELLRVLAVFGIRPPAKKGRAPKAMSPLAMQALLEQVKETPQAPFLSAQLLRSLMKAKYLETCLGHFGLALKYYCHFTSPIRRYPDLFIHRVLSEALTGMKRAEKGRLAAIAPRTALETSAAELRAERAERDIDDLYKTLYMTKHVGETYDAVVTSVTPFGLFAALPNTVEGLIHISSLDDDYYEYSEERLELRGTRGGRVFRLGDALRVTVARADIVARQIDFVLENGTYRPAPARAKPAGLAELPGGKKPSKGPGKHAGKGKETKRKTPGRPAGKHGGGRKKKK